MRAPLRLALLAALLLPAPAGADMQSSELIARGKYLADIGDCVACHTIPGQQMFSGGRPIETPFGNLVTPNITPDRDTGIGAWTDEEFIRAVKRGIGRNGEHLYPAMPYTYYTRATDDDVRAIRAYLATVPAVRREVRTNQLPFPFNVRASLVGWDELFFKPGDWKDRPDKSAEWNRGGYLVEGLGHCGACHTPKNALGGDENSRHLYGNTIQRWWAPGLNSDRRSGLGAWSVEEIVRYLRAGHNRWGNAAGPMGEEIADSSSRISDADLRAMAVYLKDQPGPGDEDRKPLDAGDSRMKLGEAIYVDQCAACHTMRGEGVPHLISRLAGSPALQGAEPTTIVRIILQGARSVGTDEAPTASAMPGFDWKLDDEQVAAVATYVRNAWGNAAPAVSAGDVRSLRAALKTQPDQ